MGATMANKGSPRPRSKVRWHRTRASLSEGEPLFLRSAEREEDGSGAFECDAANCLDGDFFLA
jgi:hypothetical protein